VIPYLKRLFTATYDVDAKQAVLNAHEMNPDARVLDCGCGTGEYTMEVARKIGVTDIAGIDASPSAVADAVKNGVRAIVGNLNNPLPFPDNSLDVVHATGIVDHLDDVDGFFKEARRVLKPGGYLLVLTSNLAANHHILSLMLGRQPSIAHISDKVLVGTLGIDGDHWEPLKYGYLKKVFTVRALTALLWHYGFRVGGITGVGYYPLPLRFARLACKLDRTHAAYCIVKAHKNVAKKSNRQKRVEFVDTDFAEVYDFVSSLSESERRYYPIRWEDLATEAVFVRGYRCNGKLVGVTGVSRKYLVAYSAFYLVKEAYWGKGIGTRMSEAILHWSQEHHIPCIIIQYSSENKGLIRVLQKSKIPLGSDMGGGKCSIVPIGKYTGFIRYIMLVLARCYYRLMRKGESA